ncbi:hypothetical protein LCGC14_2779560 [marine sediment metagenome]|uniref:Uncharacterized protein n=1 Tax=marine sediment metagenome TaxID=412755 RepID=A0A0F9B2H7_9ZZZZ
MAETVEEIAVREAKEAASKKEKDEKPAEKLLAGKFKSVEALEKGYEEAQKMGHEKSQDAAKWKRTSEELLSASELARGTKGDEDADKDAEAFRDTFLENPHAGLSQFGEKLVSTLVTRVSDYIDGREAVKSFADENPVIKANPRLFAVHMAQADSNLPLSERLAAALGTFKGDLATITKTAKEEDQRAKDFEDNQKKQAATDDAASGKPGSKKKKDDDEPD